MGKGNGLWDDSALTNAFDHAVAAFNEMHSINNHGDNLKEGTDTSDRNEENIAFIENTTVHTEAEKENRYISSDTMETCLPNDCIKMPLDGKSTQANNLTDRNNSCSSDQQNTGYNQLLNQYYELENQKQKVIEQLNQANYWNYENPTQNAMGQPSQVSEYATSGNGVQTSYQPCSCHCVAVPLISSACSQCCPPQLLQCPQFSSGLKASVTAVPGSVYSINHLKENHGAITAGNLAAESKKNPMKVEVANSSRDNEENKENERCSEADETDITTVLNAWYTAGFYTGRYLLEQSTKNVHR